MNKRTALSQRLVILWWVCVAAAFGAVTLMYFVLFWKLSFVDMPGNECDSDTCPRGMGWLFLFTPATGLLTVLAWAFVKDAKEEPRRSCLVRLVAVVVALAALWPGWRAYEWMRGPQMYVSGWQMADGSGAAKPLGVWAPPDQGGGLLVRARVDGLVAFDGEGRHGWRLPAPDRAPLCALGRATSAGIGLVVHEEGARGCGARVTAVELTEGRRLWTRETAGQPVAAVGGTAVLAQPDAVLGLDLREGGELWRLPVAADCRVGAVDGAGSGGRHGAGAGAGAAGAGAVGPVVYVEECGGGARSRVVAVDARTGARAWETALPTASPLSELRVLSATPLAVRVKESVPLGTDAVLLFDAGGAIRGQVPAAALEGEPLVTDGLLVSAVKTGKKSGVAAYSLTDGRRAWQRGLGEERVLGLAPAEQPGEVAVVSTDHWWTYLTRLGRDDGGRREEATVLREMPLGSRFTFRPGPPGAYVFVNLDADDELFPTFEVLPVWGW
ncbi:PQQ-binding-like beta-propeller repeat protein [Streptomyces sp. NPDC004126]|uniref:outer membrane protein assembly factor BamB family protein n=1 Tax=Streptomyces sp. NPDC004126 TaxID=3390695 RepID=UPI003D0895DB